MTPVYEGVTDSEACRTLGGTPGVIIGWGTQSYCEVPDDEVPDSQQ
jgi:hypothetical protein